jgi:hypothetical protein
MQTYAIWDHAVAITEAMKFALLQRPTHPINFTLVEANKTPERQTKKVFLF